MVQVFEAEDFFGDHADVRWTVSCSHCGTYEQIGNRPDRCGACGRREQAMSETGNAYPWASDTNF